MTPSHTNRTLQLSTELVEPFHTMRITVLDHQYYLLPSLITNRYLRKVYPIGKLVSVNQTKINVLKTSFDLRKNISHTARKCRKKHIFYILKNMFTNSNIVTKTVLLVIKLILNV